MTRYRSLSTAGFAATAVSYGPARMGFGLFVPQFREDFALSTSAVGLLSSLGFLGFFLGLLVAQALLNRRGPAAPVLAGLGAATLGMAIVALAPGTWVLAAGVFLAMSSAGFAWTPFNDAVHRTVSPIWRPSALSRISTGTSLGVGGAAAAALAAAISGLSWRACWGAFAAAGVLALIANRQALTPVGKDPRPAPLSGWRGLMRAEAAPLYAVGFVYGAVSAVWISFAADRMAAAGGAPGLSSVATPAAAFLLYGAFGLSGLLTGRARTALGLAPLLRLLMLAGAASAVLAAEVPGRWAGLALSAALQGVFVMMTSAVLAFWSDARFPALPSLSFTAVLLSVAAGSVAGPALAGLLADAAGGRAMFLASAALPAATALALRRRHARETPPLTPA